LRAELLPGLAAGERIGTAALWEPGGRGVADRVETTVRSGRLSGIKRPVPDGAQATLFVVAARDEAGAVGLHVVDAGDPGVRVRPVPALDPTRPQAEVTFDGARARPLDATDDLLDRVLDHAAVYLAFEQLGGAQRCLELATEYARERYQFGRPIGSFQAIKHRLADMFVAIELARSNCYYGGWALAEDADDVRAAASTARVAASEAYTDAARETLHVHGGIGFTWEGEPHLFLKRARTLELLLGPPEQWRERLMRALLAEQRVGAVGVA
jgi:alkylation response protein AidB-like acyl-CoA dehydrogenase